MINESPDRSYSRRSWFGILKIISLMLTVLGLFGLLPGCFVRSHRISIDPSFELPLARVESIAVDSEGHIYCASAYYARIQKYDSSGRYLKGWPVATNGGVFSLRIGELNHVEVFVERGDKMHIFDTDGNLVRSLPVDRNEVGQFNGLILDSNIGTLAVKYRLFAPRIVRIGPDGKSTVLISTKFPELLFMGPLPAWAFFAAGLILWDFAQRKSRRRSIPLVAM